MSPTRLALAIAALCAACGVENPDTPRPDGGSPATDARVADAAVPDAGPVPAGDRVLAMEVNEPAGLDHGAQLALAQGLGVTGVALTMPWSYLEPDDGLRDVSYLQFGLDYYRARDLDVVLSIPTLDTVALLLPEDLRAAIEAGTLVLDDAAVIARLEALLDDVLAAAGDELAYLVLANEIDIHLASKPQAYWDAFAAFFAAGVAHVHAARPALPVGLSVTFTGIASGDARLAALARAGDVVFATYYEAGNFGTTDDRPLAAHLDDMVAFADGRPLVLKELGYATGAALGGSEDGQAAFWDEAFAAWDDHAAAVPLVMVSRMFDGARADCEAQAASYGLPGDEAFIQFLCTLGLRRLDDTAKPAWGTLAAAAAARGF
jgi:hypothetical protein